jgi:AcrR family transcriptional regulator
MTGKAPSSNPSRARKSRRRAKPADIRAGETKERILEAAAELLRRHGPAKTTVVDVARALDMSHANVYRHFANKAALRDAVAERWLKTVSQPLQTIVRAQGDAAERLERWILALAEIKRRKVLSDPELFATYHAIVTAVRNVADDHVAELHRQVAAIIRDGVTQGIFKVSDAEAAAGAVLSATLRFHHPHHVRESAGRANEAEIRAVLKLVLAGLRAGIV